MPRVADHELRRRQVTEATMRVMVARGMDGLTVASVAAEAGVSVGLVQHYFRSKDDLVLLTFEYSSARLADRLRAAKDLGGTSLQRARRCLAEFLPLDEERTAEVRIYLTFCGRAVENERLREVQAESYRVLRAVLTDMITEAQRRGEVAMNRDPTYEAVRLWSLVDGVTLQSFADPAGFSAVTALAVIDGHLTELFAA